jgi:hypothetical protein
MCRKTLRKPRPKKPRCSNPAFVGVRLEPTAPRVLPPRQARDRADEDISSILRVA